MTPATKEEVGEDKSSWLDPQYVAQWQSLNEEKVSSSKTKGESKGKGKDTPSTALLTNWMRRTRWETMFANTRASYANRLT
jgi:hypothetical protein